jgi:hypothetical protein
MKKNILISILLILVVALLGINLLNGNDDVRTHKNFIMTDFINSYADDMNNEDSKVIPISQYDEIIIIPPYTSKEVLETNGSISSGLVNDLHDQLKTDENYSLFIIENDEVIYHEVFNGKYKTKDEKILHLTSEDQLKILKKDELRPYILMN